MATEEQQQDLVSPIAQLKRLQLGEVSFSTMPKEGRLACIEYLVCKGHNNAELAEILKVSIRTIQRGKQTLRRQNAVQITEEFKAEQIGGLVRSAEMLTGRLLQISSRDSTFDRDKINALELIWKIQKENVRMFQSLGHLPYYAPLQGAARQDQVPDMTEIAEEIATIEHAVAQGEINDPNILRLLRAQRDLLAATCPDDQAAHMQNGVDVSIERNAPEEDHESETRT